MNRTITYNITEGDNGIKITHFLRRCGFSRQSLIELKKFEGSVTVDGMARHFNERLHTGSTLRVFITDNAVGDVPPVDLPVRIVYEDADILVVNKPAGMPTHPSFKNTHNTLANALAWHYRALGEPFVFRCSNRLDRDTSGLTIVSKHFVSAAIISEMGTRREISREYLAIVQGHVAPSEGTINASLGRKDSSIIERCVDFEHGERAVTHYRVEAYLPVPSLPSSAASADPYSAASADLSAGCDPFPGEESGLTLVSLKLETRRTHQIRVHMAHIGHPLAGDYLYNPADRDSHPLIGRQALHAFRLSFSHPITKEALSFTAPLPEDMRSLLGTAGDPVIRWSDDPMI